MTISETTHTLTPQRVTWERSCFWHKNNKLKNGNMEKRDFPELLLQNLFQNLQLQRESKMWSQQICHQRMDTRMQHVFSTLGKEAQPCIAAPGPWCPFPQREKCTKSLHTHQDLPSRDSSGTWGRSSTRQVYSSGIKFIILYHWMHLQGLSWAFSFLCLPSLNGNLVLYLITTISSS